MKNTLLAPWDSPYGVPLFSMINDADFEEAFKQAMENAETNFTKISNNLEAPTFENTIEEMERGEVDQDVYDQLQGINIPGQGLSYIGINTAALQEKRDAVDILLRFVYALNDHFGPFVASTVEALLPSVQKGKYSKATQ